MSQIHNEFDLMEKGEAGNLKKDTPLESLPTSPSSTKIGSNDWLETKSESEKQNVFPWLSNLSSSLSDRTRQLFQHTSHSEEEIPETVVESVVRSLEECPKGYPQLAAFLDSDENFMLYRRFGFLQARILLYKQDELRQLEEELDSMDQDDLATRPKKLTSREGDDAERDDRKKLIQKITEKFRDYAELLKTAQDLASFNRAPARDYKSVTRYFKINSPLKHKESYIYRKEDIITLKPGRENAWLDAIVEKFLQAVSCPLIRRLFCDEDLRKKTDPKRSEIILYSRTRINMIVSLIITIVILALLIIPVYLLWHITRAGNFDNTMTAVIIGLLLVFTLVFSGTLSLFTRAKRHEVLAAAAGYCAVLVVFIGNIGQLSSSPSQT